MIEEIDRRLAVWAQSVLGDAAFALVPPGQVPGGHGVSCYLLALAERPPLRNLARAPLQIALRYLFTTMADTAEEAHRLLGRLVFAALDDPGWEVELEPLAAETWAALKALPQPAFILRVPLTVERPTPPVKRVRKPLEVRAAPVGSLHGYVLGPDDIPLPDAVVELPAYMLVTRTDASGHFLFPAVPLPETSAGQQPAVCHCRVWAKGEEFAMDVPAGPTAVTIRVPLRL